MLASQIYNNTPFCPSKISGRILEGQKKSIMVNLKIAYFHGKLFGKMK